MTTDITYTVEGMTIAEPMTVAITTTASGRNKNRFSPNDYVAIVYHYTSHRPLK